MRLTGKNGKLFSYSRGTLSTAGDDLTAGTWYEFGGTAEATNPGLAKITAGMFVYADATMTVTEGTFYPLTLTEILDLTGYDVSMSQDTIDVSALDDEVGQTEFGRRTFSGTINAIFTQPDNATAHPVIQRAIEEIRIKGDGLTTAGDAGEVTVLSRSDDPIRAMMFFNDGADQKRALITAALKVGNFQISVTDGSAQAVTAQLSLSSDLDVPGRPPRLYTVY